jgi:DNA repair exonuclease SbcCD ATPase subunit
MEEETYQKPRRKLSFIDNHHSQRPSFTQFYSNNHSSDYLQLAIYNLNQLIKQSEQQIIEEQQLITIEENNKLNKIQNLQNEINHLQTNIDSLNNEIEKLTTDTYEMLVRQSESALIRHNQLLKESIEHINHVLRKRSIANDSSLEQLKKELTNQQEKLFLIRNQLDIDHNRLATNMSLLKECQQQRNQFEQIKLKKQVDLQNIQQIQSKFLFFIQIFHFLI